MRLKTWALLPLLLALIPSACKKPTDKPYMNTAVITGYDLRTLRLLRRTDDEF
jgi:hypothetical protein